MTAAIRVLDSYALLVYVQGERGKQKMIDLFESAAGTNIDLLLSTINWGEVIYSNIRTFGQLRADETARLISRLPIEIVSADLELARQAAVFKATKKMSYADCFAAALAKLHKAELVTGNKEFKQVEGEVKIVWI